MALILYVSVLATLFSIYTARSVSEHQNFFEHTQKEQLEDCEEQFDEFDKKFMPDESSNQSG